ncbi:hypothetical protein D3C85_1591440 [compost metagenome]
MAIVVLNNCSCTAKIRIIPCAIQCCVSAISLVILDNRVISIPWPDPCIIAARAQIKAINCIVLYDCAQCFLRDNTVSAYTLHIVVGNHNIRAWVPIWC